MGINGTNGTDFVTEPRLRAPAEAGPSESADFALAPLVDKIAYSIARGLVVAVKELEDHIGSETRKVGDAVDRRLDALQATLDDISRFVGDQRATNTEVQGQLQQLRADTTASSSGLAERIDAARAVQQESEARQAAEISALQSETRAFSQAVSERIDGVCKDLGIHQEDIAAIKATLCTFSTQVDSLVERLDRQADAVRSLCTAYSQRETELEQLVDGLARLRAFPTPMPANRL
jgi:chromosome segregation ATPase